MIQMNLFLIEIDLDDNSSRDPYNKLVLKNFKFFIELSRVFYLRNLSLEEILFFFLIITF